MAIESISEDLRGMCLRVPSPVGRGIRPKHFPNLDLQFPSLVEMRPLVCFVCSARRSQRLIQLKAIVLQRHSHCAVEIDKRLGVIDFGLNLRRLIGRDIALPLENELQN